MQISNLLQSVLLRPVLETTVSRGRVKTTLLDAEAVSRFFEPHQKDPAADSEIQRHLDALDEVAREMEATWGVGRLIPLVDDVLRGKFFKNMAALNKAVEAGKVDEVEKQATSLARGWRAMDAAARHVGHKPKPHTGLEIRLQDGRVVAIVPTDQQVPNYRTDGTEVVTLTEGALGLILSDLLSTESTLGAVLSSPLAPVLTGLRRKPEPDWGKGDDLPF